MTQRIVVSFVSVLAVTGLIQPAFASHNCAQFASGCASAPIGTFTQAQVEGLGGTFVSLEKCSSSESCDRDKAQGIDQAYCSPGLDPGICEQLVGFLAPTVSEWGIAVMALFTLISGTLVLKRRRTVAGG